MARAADRARRPRCAAHRCVDAALPDAAQASRWRSSHLSGSGRLLSASVVHARESRGGRKIAVEFAAGAIIQARASKLMIRYIKKHPACGYDETQERCLHLY